MQHFHWTFFCWGWDPSTQEALLIKLAKSSLLGLCHHATAVISKVVGIYMRVRRESKTDVKWQNEKERANLTMTLLSFLTYVILYIVCNVKFSKIVCLLCLCTLHWNCVVFNTKRNHYNQNPFLNSRLGIYSLVSMIWKTLGMQWFTLPIVQFQNVESWKNWRKCTIQSWI